MIQNIYFDGNSLSEVNSSWVQSWRRVCGFSEEKQHRYNQLVPCAKNSRICHLYLLRHITKLLHTRLTVLFFNIMTKPVCTDVRLINFLLHRKPGAVKVDSVRYFNHFSSKQTIIHSSVVSTGFQPGLQGHSTCSYLLVSNTWLLYFLFLQLIFHLMGEIEQKGKKNKDPRKSFKYYIPLQLQALLPHK